MVDRTLLKCAVVLAGLTVVRLGTSFPLGAAWGPALAAIQVLSIVPLWVFLAIKAGPALAARGGLFTALVLAVDGASMLGDKSYFGVAAHVIQALAGLFLIAWISGGDLARYGFQFKIDSKMRIAGIVIGVIVALLIVVPTALVLTGTVSRQALSPPPISYRETIVFQLFLVAISEEVIWRGLLQTTLDEVLPGRVRWLGAELGWGALVSCLLFAAAHMFKLTLDPFDLRFNFGPQHLFSAALYVWLRAFSRSIWPAIAMHGLWNGVGNTLRYVFSITP